jgi:hypothetical protein
MSLRTIIVGVSILIGIGTSALAQPPVQYGAQTYGIGARAAALAEAYISDPYDVTAMYWNPGALLYIQQPSIVITHSQDVSTKFMMDNVAIPLHSTRSEMIAVGVTLNHHGYLQKDLTYDFRAMQYGYDIAYSREVMPTVSIGGRVGVQYGTSGTSHLWAAATSVGIFYSPAEEISYGASVNGLGSAIEYAYDNSSLTVNSVNMPRSLQVGATMRFPAEVKQSIFLVSIANEKIFGKDGLRYKGGVELFPIPVLALRAGYLNEPGFSVGHYGLGVRMGRFSFDYALSPGPASDRTHSLAISFDFWDHTQNIQR